MVKGWVVNKYKMLTVRAEGNLYYSHIGTCPFRGKRNCFFLVDRKFLAVRPFIDKPIW